MSMVLNPFIYGVLVPGFWQTVHGASVAADSFHVDGQLTKTASAGWGNCSAFSFDSFARSASLVVKFPS